MVTIAEMKPVDSPTIFEKTNTQKLNDLLFIEDEKYFIERAKALAITLLETENNEHKITELRALIEACNQSLYAYNSALTKSAVMGKLEALIT